jgi:hypothetical protein
MAMAPRHEDFTLQPESIYDRRRMVALIGVVASDKRIVWFSNGRNTVSVGVTGSGDVTFDAQFFHRCFYCRR